MAVQTLVIENIVRGFNKIKAYTVELTRVDKAAKAAQSSVEDANEEIGETGAAAAKSATGVKSLVRYLGKAAAAYATVAIAQKSMQAGIQRAESERRIQFLAQGYGEAAELAQAASIAAVKFGQSQTEANKALATAYARLRPVGTSLKDIESVYTGFNTAARVSGANAVEASNAFTQLAQALGAGALRGDEFNSIAEQVPAILTAVAQETGVAQGQLRKYAAEGKITADVVIAALKRIETEGADQLASAMNGPAQKVRDLQIVMEELMVAVSETIVPEMSKAFGELARVIKGLKGPIRLIGGLLGGLLSKFNDAITAAQSLGAMVGIGDKGVVGRTKLEEGKTLTLGEAEALFKGTGPGEEGFEGMRKQARELAKLRHPDLFKEGLSQSESIEQMSKWGANPQAQVTSQILTQLMKDRLATMDGIGGSTGDLSMFNPTKPKPSVLTPTSKSGSGGTADAAKKAAEEQNRLEKEQEAIRKRLTTSLERELELKEAVTPLDKEIAQINHDYADTLTDISALLDENEKAQLKVLATQIKKLKTAEAEADAEKRKADETKRAAAEAARAAEAAKGKVEKYKDQLAADLADTEGMIVKLAQSVEGAMANAMSSAVMGVITGTKTVEEALSEMFKQIAAAFIDMATKMIAKAIILKALGALGGGGGSSFVPTGGWDNFGPQFAEGGYVTGPTQALIGEGGDAEYVIPAQKMAEAMERYSSGIRGNAVIPESVGGESGSADSPFGDLSTAINISGGVLNFNDESYIKQDQLPSIITQASKGGEARTLAKLRSSPATRRRIGMA